VEDLIGSPITPGQVAPAVRVHLDAFEEAQASRQVVSKGEGVLRRVTLDPTRIFLPDLGEWDTKASGGMAFAIIVALITGLSGIGGLTEGSWAVWLLPVSGAAIVAAIVLGKRWGGQGEKARAGGIDRDGIYFLPMGVVIRSLDRYKVYPLSAIRRFELGSYIRGIRWVRMCFVAGGVAQYANIGNDRELDEELLEIVESWLTESRAAETSASSESDDE